MKHSSKRCLQVLVIIVLAIVVSLYLFATNIFSFLCPNEPTSAQILVIEGWMPDYALKKASEHFSTTPYEVVVVTGGPLQRGSFLSEYKTYADLGCGSLKAITDSKNIVAVPAPAVSKDRTYASGIALRKWLEEQPQTFEGINIVSFDVHSRRTWYLFRKALGDAWSTGIVSIDNIDYEGTRWWSSSYGFRSVLYETVAYGYTRLFFRVADDLSGN